jgi:hypothetical protein
MARAENILEGDMDNQCVYPGLFPHSSRWSSSSKEVIPPPVTRRIRRWMPGKKLAPEEAGNGQCSRPASSSGSVSSWYSPSPLPSTPNDDGVVASSHEDDAESSIWELAGDHASLSTATLPQRDIHDVKSEIYMFRSGSSSSEELIEDKPHLFDVPESVILVASDTSSTSHGSSVIILASTTAVSVRDWARSEFRRREVRKAL